MMVISLCFWTADSSGQSAGQLPQWRLRIFIRRGHAEIRKWKDPDTLAAKIPPNPKGPIDVPWIQARTSAPIDPATPFPP